LKKQNEETVREIEMASLTSNKPRNFGAYSHYATPCTRTHQIGALFLVVSTFFVTRLFDQWFSESNSVTPVIDLRRTSSSYGIKTDNGIIRWPERGYGSHLSLKIYVYDENEIDGLKELLYGRDGSVKTTACLKGQWGSQVKIHKLLLESKFRTIKKDEADLFFVPAYVKCVRMLGGLNDKEINQTYVKVNEIITHSFKLLMLMFYFVVSNYSDMYY
jgi:hypothetical protein